jgi:hypothetical protein
MTEGIATIGTALPAIMAGVTIETGSSELATTGSTRLNDQQLAEMERVANLPLAAPIPCDAADFAKLMRSLSILPSRADDELTGKLRLNIYHRMMGQYPRAAIAYMVETALSTLDWFPTPKQCLDILAGWLDHDAVVHKRRTVMAASAVRQERQARLNDVMDALYRRDLDQEQIDALPDQMKVIGAERGFLRLHDDGVYRARPVPVPTNG